MSEVQSSIGVYKTGNPWVYFIDPKYISGNGLADYSKIAPQSIAGQYGYHPYLYGPHWFNIDISLNKTLPIRENLRFTFQAEFLNALNHPTFGPVTSGASVANIQSRTQTFGQTTGGPSGPRVVEFRANIEF